MYRNILTLWEKKSSHRRPNVKRQLTAVFDLATTPLPLHGQEPIQLQHPHGAKTPRIDSGIQWRSPLLSSLCPPLSLPLFLPLLRVRFTACRGREALRPPNRPRVYTDRLSAPCLPNRGRLRRLVLTNLSSSMPYLRPRILSRGLPLLDSLVILFV